jgi:hypothetical protein
MKKKKQRRSLRLQCTRASMDEVEVELPDDLRVLENAEGYKGTCLEVAAPLELKHVAFGAHDGLASL